MAEVDDPFSAYFTSMTPKAAPQPVAPAPIARTAPQDTDEFSAYYQQKTPKPAPAPAPVDYAKMPWGEVASRAYAKAPESLVGTVKSTVEPFLHPQETVKGLGQVVGGLYSKGRTALGYEPDPTRAGQEQLVEKIGEHYGRYFSEPGLKQAIAEDPFGAFADVGSAVSLGGLGAARVPGTIGKVGQIAKTAGELASPVTAGIKAAEAVSPIIPSLAKGALSGASGLSYGTLGDFFEAGKKFKPGILKKALLDEPDPQAAVSKVSDAIASMRDERQANYLASKAGLQNQHVPLSFDNVDNALKGVESIAFGPNKIVKNKEAAAALEEIRNKINEFKHPATPGTIYNTMLSFDALKQAIDDIGFGYRGNKAKEIVSKIRNAAKKTISDHDPKYADMMDEYADATREIGEMERELGGKGAHGATGAPLRKLLGAQKNAYKKTLLQELEKRAPGIGTDLSAMEVAQSKIPFWRAVGSGGLGYLFHPAAGLAGAAASMPQVAAPAMWGLGAASRIPEVAAQVAKPAIAATRVAHPAFNKDRPIDISRSTGGSTPSDDSSPSSGKGMTAEMMISKSKQARKKRQAQTKVILDQPDDHVVKALKVASDTLHDSDA